MLKPFINCLPAESVIFPFPGEYTRLSYLTTFLCPLKTLLPSLLNCLRHPKKAIPIGDSHWIPWLSSPLPRDPFDKDQITLFWKVKLFLLYFPVSLKPDLDYLPCSGSASHHFSSSHTQLLFPKKCWALILLPLAPVCFNSSPCGVSQQEGKAAVSTYT